MAINGLKLQITSAQLEKLLTQREEYHLTRAKKFEERAKVEKQDEDEAMEDAFEIGKYGTSNVARGFGGQSAAERFRHHTDRATVAKFRREHLLPNETYILEEEDLRLLEVLPLY